MKLLARTSPTARDRRIAVVRPGPLERLSTVCRPVLAVLLAAAFFLAATFYATVQPAVGQAGIDGVYDVQESDQLRAPCEPTPFRRALAADQTGPNYSYELLVTSSAGQVSFGDGGGALFVANLSPDGTFTGDNGSRFPVEGAFQSGSGSEPRFSMEWIQDEPGGAATCTTQISGRQAQPLALPPGPEASPPATSPPQLGANPPVSPPRLDVIPPGVSPPPVAAIPPTAGPRVAADPSVPTSGRDGGGGVSPRTAAVLVALGGAVLILVLVGGRRKFLRPRKQYAGGNPWDPDDTERVRRWNKEGLAWDDRENKWRPWGEVELIDPATVDVTRLPPAAIPEHCKHLDVQVKAQANEIAVLTLLIKRRNEARQIYQANLARANVVVGWQIIDATIAVARGVAAVPSAVHGVRRLARSARKPSFADPGTELSRLRTRRQGVSADLDTARTRVAQLESEAVAAASKVRQGRAALAAAEVKAAAAERSARQTIMSEAPPAELLERQKLISSRQEQLKAELKSLEGLDGVDDETVRRIQKFNEKAKQAWLQSPEYKNIHEESEAALAAWSEFHASPQGEMGKFQSQVRDALESGSISQAKAQELLGSVDQKALADFNRMSQKLNKQIELLADRARKLEANFRARQPSYSEEMDRHVPPFRRSVEADRRYVEGLLAGVNEGRAEIDAKIENFRNQVIAKNDQVLNEAAAAQRTAIDLKEALQHPEHLQRSANESLRLAQANLARKTAQVSEIDSRIGELSAKLARLDAEAQQPPVHSWLSSEPTPVHQKLFGSADTPHHIVRTLTQNKLDLAQIEKVVGADADARLKRMVADWTLTTERLRNCVAVHQPRAAASGGRRDA